MIERVNIPSYLVKPGQRITLAQEARSIPDVQELLEYRPPIPAWLEAQEGAVVREPDRTEIDPEIEEQLIVEFYSR